MELANEYNSIFINFDSYYSKFKQINEKLLIIQIQKI